MESQSRESADSLDDELVLARAAQHGRILVSHDKRTMPRRLVEFVRKGGMSPGVLLVIRQQAFVRDVADTLTLIWADNRPEEWAYLVAKIPF